MYLLYKRKQRKLIPARLSLCSRAGRPVPESADEEALVRLAVPPEDERPVHGRDLEADLGRGVARAAHVLQVVA